MPALSTMTIEDRDRERLRIQDRELMQMVDDGMCLSMHQPWASLLVRGIKMSVTRLRSARRPRILPRHEGRTWYTSHRGRLWIHAAAKEPDRDDISTMETFYKSRNSGTRDDPRLHRAISTIV